MSYGRRSDDGSLRSLNKNESRTGCSATVQTLAPNLGYQFDAFSTENSIHVRIGASLNSVHVTPRRPHVLIVIVSTLRSSTLYTVKTRIWLTLNASE